MSKDKPREVTSFTIIERVRSRRGSILLLRIASAMTLLALALMMWGFFQPRALQIIFSLSVGQAIGTLSLLAYGYVVVRDITRARRDTKHAAEDAAAAEALNAPKVVLPAEPKVITEPETKAATETDTKADKG